MRLQLLTVVQTGVKFTPLMLIETTSTGAVPVSVTLLEEITNVLPPTVKVVALMSCQLRDDAGALAGDPGFR